MSSQVERSSKLCCTNEQLNHRKMNAPLPTLFFEEGCLHFCFWIRDCSYKAYNCYYVNKTMLKFCLSFLEVLIIFYVSRVICCLRRLQWLHGHLQNRNTNCCNDLHIKCWRHYLKDIKVEHFKPFRGCEDNVAELMDRWLLIPEGELWLHLDWCFSELNEKLWPE